MLLFPMRTLLFFNCFCGRGQGSHSLASSVRGGEVTVKDENGIVKTVSDKPEKR